MQDRMMLQDLVQDPDIVKVTGGIWKRCTPGAVERRFPTVFGSGYAGYPAQGHSGPGGSGEGIWDRHAYSYGLREWDGGDLHQACGIRPRQRVWPGRSGRSGVPCISRAGIESDSFQRAGA